MSEELTTAVALAIFVQHCKNEGKTKSEADDMWRTMGSANRGLWRLCAKAALQAEEIAEAARKQARAGLATTGGFKLHK